MQRRMGPDQIPITKQQQGRRVPFRRRTASPPTAFLHSGQQQPGSKRRRNPSNFLNRCTEANTGISQTGGRDQRLGQTRAVSTINQTQTTNIAGSRHSPTCERAKLSSCRLANTCLRSCSHVCLYLSGRTRKHEKSNEMRSGRILEQKRNNTHDGMTKPQEPQGDAHHDTRVRIGKQQTNSTEACSKRDSNRTNVNVTEA